MNISIDNLRQLNSLEIYELFKNNFENFYNQYKNIVISTDEYKKIVLEEIENTKQNYDSDTNYINFLLKRIEGRIRIEQEIKDDSNYHILSNEIKDFSVLDQDEVYDLVIKAQNGDKEAKNKLVNHNIKLVISIAKKYIGNGVEMDDLIQEGTFGLYTAIERFDISKGFKFSTYANWWIKQSIISAIHQYGRNIRIPTNKYEEIQKYKATYKLLYSKLNREPTIDEIAEEMKIPYEKCLSLYFLQSGTISYNQKVSSDESEETELGYFLESDENVEEDIEKNSLKEDVRKTLSKAGLTNREYYVIVHRFGMFGMKKMTLEDLGNNLSITRERVRQVEKKALTKLKRTFKKYNLNSYVTIDASPKEPGVSVDLYSHIRNKLTSTEFNFFYECGLTPLEMEVSALSMGLIDHFERNYRQIGKKHGKQNAYN
jgi:RNA polymerase primary sigma factor